MLRVLHLAATDGAGGADRAAYRVHEALQHESSVDSRMLVSRRTTEDPSVETIETTWVGRNVGPPLRRLARYEKRALLRTPNAVIHSTARIPTTAPRRITAIGPDVVLLHWLGSEVLSIRQMGRLARSGPPLAWLLHDEWAFCGAEHYPEEVEGERFTEGYRRRNRPVGERGVDLNRLTWARKLRNWTAPIHLVAPSTWMEKQIRRSALMGQWQTTVIPYPLAVDWWGSVARDRARHELGLDPNRPIILFGAVGGEANPRKGGDLLRLALPRVFEQRRALRQTLPELITFGGAPGVTRVGAVAARSVGRLDDTSLRLHYSAADVVVVPSRQEAFGQTASEAMACGTPVMAFAVGGLTDIVEDGVNGRLAPPFSTEALAEGILWVLGDRDRHRRLSEAASRSASRWDPERVARMYVDVFSQIQE